MSLPKGSSRALALAGHGTGLTNRVLGSATGVETVSPSTTTMAIHAHNLIGGSSGVATSTLAQYDPNANMSFAGTSGVESTSMQLAGGGTPVNIMQPTTFINVMVKL
jgi:microcystin-dependent protein